MRPGTCAGPPRTATARCRPPALDLNEINEAFAGVALASGRDPGVPADRVNVNRARSRSTTRSG
jgi:hypothetical protein